MNSALRCDVKGQYKVDLYSGGGPNRVFVSSTDWFDNDITNYGLNYPFVYSFADCFKFLSLSSLGWGSTTARQNATAPRSPITTFSVINGFTGVYNQSGQYIGWQGYEIGGPHNPTFAGSFSSACGTKFTNKGLDLHRGWTIPTGTIDDGTVMNQDLVIGGFMVSPGSGANTTGSGAFSLVDRSVTIPSGFTATITYQLSLNFQSYQNRTFFSGISGDSNGYFDVSNASTGVNGSETGLLSGWAKFSGIYRQILPGLQVVDGIGASVVPSWGDQLEPQYTDCQKLYFYLSPDISQFAVSKFGALPDGITESGAYNSDGLMANYTSFANRISGDLNIYGTDENTWPSEPDKWYYSGDSQKNSSTQVTISIPSNIRLQSLLSTVNYSGGELPITNFNYQVKGYINPLKAGWPVIYATPGKMGFDDVNYPDYGQRAVYSTYLKRVPTSGFSSATGIGGVSVRSKKVTKRGSISPIQSMGVNSRYGTLTLGYLTAAGSIGDLSFAPYIDFLFFNSSGRAADNPHYRLLPDMYLMERGSGVAQVTFDITGVGGTRPSSINRLWNIYGFMGPGVDPNNPSTPSGLDINHPMYQNGQANASGFSFPGQILNTSASGDTQAYSQSGWGSVYGVVASPTFYGYPIDTCLIESKPWSGTTFVGWTGDFSGQAPNPTGDYTKLFWPTTGSGLGIRVSGVKFHSKILNTPLNDTSNYFTGANQVAFDIQYVGGDLDGIDTSIGDWKTSANPNNQFNGLYFSDGNTTPLTTFTPTYFQFQSGTNFIRLPFATGLDKYFNSYPVFSGFNVSSQTTGIGLNRGWWADVFNQMTMSGTSGVASVGWNGVGAVYLVYFDGSNFHPLNDTTKFRVAPSQYKRPSGVIHHVENFNGSGNRLMANYGFPNNQNINYYQPIQGGAFPGLSMENGMQLFCDFIWSGG